MTQEAQYHTIPIKDEPLLTKYGFTEFRLPLNHNATKMVLYNDKDPSMITYVDFDRHNLDKSVQLLHDKLVDDQQVETRAGNDTLQGLIAYFRNTCHSLKEDSSNEFFKNGNGKSGNKARKKSEPQDPKKEIFAQRYVVDNSIAEAVIVGGRPKFAITVPKVGYPDQISSIALHDAIEIGEDMVIKPPEFISYINKPHVFKSEQEFQDLVANIKTKDLDALYKKVKSIWKKYVDADDFHISICTADTIFTYFQDKMGLTHYLFFIGGNDSGKTNNLTMFHFLAYRNMMSSGMTAANVYTYLGSGEEGIGTICEDEADNIDQDPEKMRVYKNGYTAGIPYHRTDTSAGRQQLKFNTFCFKAFAAEKLPDSVTAKGFNQRTIELPCVYGFSAYDISEVVNPAGDEEYEESLQELHIMRNALLVYRLLHFHDKIPNIKLNIQNREKQLFKPVLRVFQNSQTINELLPVISKYVGQRRESNANTLHAFLYRLVMDLIRAQNTYELESGLIWNTIRETLQVKEIPYKPQSYDTVEFGIISQKEVIQALKEVFGASAPKKRHGNSRTLVFDKSKLDRLSKIYGVDIEVQVMTGSDSSPHSPHLPHLPHVGLDRHIEEQPGDNEIAINQEQRRDNSKEAEVNDTKIISAEHSKDVQYPKQVAEAAEVADMVLDESSTAEIQGQQGEQKIPDSIYRAYGDTWKCRNCNAKGDRWFMIKHYCRGQLKPKSGGSK